VAAAPALIGPLTIAADAAPRQVGAAMNWLTNYVLPKIRALTRKEVPDNLWRKCPSCEQMLFHRELAEHLDVCRHCGHHFRIDSQARFRMLFDGGTFDKIELPKVAVDPLRFRDRKRYTERLREGQAARGAGSDAIAAAEGRIGGIATIIAAFDFEFMGGSMGMAVGEGLVTAARCAVEREAALIVVPASGGARMQEGILSLMQMPRTIIAADMVKEAGLPYVVLLTDPTTGGVSASFAMLGDITLAEPDAVVGFAGARVIEETIREKLPERFQRAEYLHEHGMVDQVVPRGELRATLARLLSLLREPTRTEPLAAAEAAIAADPPEAQ
jgi:acetyl-CoA carboxylase carboxyl transferase subunit beta